MAEGTTLPEAVAILRRESYDNGYSAAQNELIADLVQMLLISLREELMYHPYQAPGLHTAIDALAGRSRMTREEWRQYLGAEDYGLMHTMSWDHPGEVRWIPPLDEDAETGSN